MGLKKRQLVNHTLKNLPLLCLTAYTKPIAEIVDLYADIILVGDSLGTVLYGFESTREVTLDLMINHAKAVCRSTSKANIIVDMPYGTYENSKIKAYNNAKKLIQRSGACGVKLEGGEKIAPTIEYLVNRGIKVMGHIGMLPQSAKHFKDYKVYGKKDWEIKQILKDIVSLEKSGVFAVVIEATTESLSKRVSEISNIPTIGIGASCECSGQILVTEDLLGLTDFEAKFVKNYCNLRKEIIIALEKFRIEVKKKKFPSKRFCYK